MLGTRPDALKLAPVVRALSASPLYEPVVIATGQHREMLDQVFEVFDLRPQVDLHLLQDRQTLTSLTSRVLTGLEALLADLAPAAVLVQGDTTTTFAGALAAFYARIPLVHVEAGLRTHDRWSPYPEEMNRRLTSQLAALHLAPTERARDNLLTEGVAADAVVVTGNTSIDALLWAVNRPAPDRPAPGRPRRPQRLGDHPWLGHLRPEQRRAADQRHPDRRPAARSRPRRRLRARCRRDASPRDGSVRRLTGQ